MSVMHFVNEVQFLNATLVLALPRVCCYMPCYKDMCVWITTKILFNDLGFKFNGCTIFISFIIICVILIIDNIPFSCCKFFGDLLSAPSNRYAIYCVSIFMRSQNQTAVAAFCENSKIVSSDSFIEEKNCCSFISFKSSNEINLFL